MARVMPLPPLRAMAARWRELAPQPGIRHLGLEHALERPFHADLHQPLEAREGQCVALVGEVDPRPGERSGAGQVPEQAFLERAVRPIGPGHQVGRRALEDLPRAGFRRDGRHELDGRSTGSHHRHALAFQGHGAVPVRRMEARAPEGFDARQLGMGGPAQLASTADQDPAGVDPAVRQGHAPQRGRFVVVGRGDFAVELDVLKQFVLAGAVAQVVQDLGLRSEHARPVGVGLEGERVQVRGHVTGRTGVGVVAPYTANVPALLDDQEVRKTRLAQGDGHAHAGKAGSDDERSKRLGASVLLRVSREVMASLLSGGVGVRGGCLHARTAPHQIDRLLGDHVRRCVGIAADDGGQCATCRSARRTAAWDVILGKGRHLAFDEVFLPLTGLSASRRSAIRNP